MPGDSPPANVGTALSPAPWQETLSPCHHPLQPPLLKAHPGSEQATGSEEVPVEPTAQTSCVVAAGRREGQSGFVLRAGKRPFLTP